MSDCGVPNRLQVAEPPRRYTIPSCAGVGRTLPARASKSGSGSSTSVTSPTPNATDAGNCEIARVATSTSARRRWGALCCMASSSYLRPSGGSVDRCEMPPHVWRQLSDDKGQDSVNAGPRREEPRARGGYADQPTRDESWLSEDRKSVV